MIQLFAVVITAAYAFSVTYVALKVINIFMPVRVEEREEIAGLDHSIHGETAYIL